MLQSLSKRLVPRQSVQLQCMYAPCQRWTHTDAAESANSDEAEASAQEFRDSVQGFAQEQVAPHAAEIDRLNAHPKGLNLWTAMGDFGLHGEGLC